MNIFCTTGVYNNDVYQVVVDDIQTTGLNSSNDYFISVV